MPHVELFPPPYLLLFLFLSAALLISLCEHFCYSILKLMAMLFWLPLWFVHPKWSTIFSSKALLIWMFPACSRVLLGTVRQAHTAAAFAFPPPMDPKLGAEWEPGKSRASLSNPQYKCDQSVLVRTTILNVTYCFLSLCNGKKGNHHVPCSKYLLSACSILKLLVSNFEILHFKGYVQFEKGWIIQKGYVQFQKGNIQNKQIQKRNIQRKGVCTNSETESHKRPAWCFQM